MVGMPETGGGGYETGEVGRVMLGHGSGEVRQTVASCTLVT